MKKSRGMAYKGSKTKIAKRLIDKMIDDSGMDNITFVDVFGGGGSMSIEACKRPEIKRVIYNELDTSVYLLFKTACLNELTLEDCEPITREEFFDKNNDSLMKLIFSYGSDNKSYFCPKQKEKLVLTIMSHYYKKAFSLREYINYVYEFKNTPFGKNLPRFEPVERIKVIKDIHNNENLDKITFHNLDYNDLPLNIPNAIYYFDPPYEGTNKYPINRDIPFNKLDLYNKIKRSNALCYVSELELYDEQSILNINHVYSISDNGLKVKVKERLFKINC